MQNSKRSISLIKTLLLLSLSGVIAQCSKGEDPEVKNFNVELLSNSPLVRRTDRTLNGVTLTANWFEMTMTFTNSTSHNVKIEELLFYITIDGVENDPLSFDLGQLSVKVGEDTFITYSNYCTYPNDGNTYRLTACSNPNTVLMQGPDENNPDEIGATSPYALQMQLYISDIPSSVEFPENFRFPVRLVMYGTYVNSAGEDQGRFQKTMYFTTE